MTGSEEIVGPRVPFGDMPPHPRHVPRKTGRESCRAGFRRSAFLAAAWTVCLGTSTGWAQTGLVTAEITRSSPAARSEAPIIVQWRINSNSKGLLEGRLEATVRDGSQVIATVESEELAIFPGEQFQRLTLPPLDVANPALAALVRLRFVGRQQTFDLGEHRLRVPGSRERTIVIGISDPWQGGGRPNKPALANLLRIDRYHANQGDRTISTVTAPFRPDELSGDPLMLCGYDLLLLMQDGLTELKEPALAGILRWVEGGGSLCVVPERERLAARHIDFLNALLSPPDEERLLLDTQGRLATPEEPSAPDPAPITEEAQFQVPPDAILRFDGSDWLHLSRRGLGRVALLLGDMDHDGAPQRLSPTEMRWMIAHLWKLRLDRLPEFLAEGTWSTLPPMRRPGVINNPADPAAQGMPVVAIGEMSQQQAVLSQMRPFDMQLASIPLQSGDQLMAQLLPRDMRVIPLSLVGLLLWIYVLVIGPVDYLLLGALKRRRLTWVCFPVVTVGFALATVAFSNRYMRGSETPRSVTIVDVGDGGRVARQNRFEVLFRSSPEEVSSDVSRGMLCALNHQNFSQGTWYKRLYSQNQGMNDPQEMAPAPRYSGRIPSDYKVRQSLPQWTPQLNRLHQLPNDDAVPDMDWEALAGLEGAKASDGILGIEARRAISAEVGRAFGPRASAEVISGSKLTHVCGPPGILQRDDARFATSGNSPRYYGIPDSTFLQDFCVGERQFGLFAVVSQISPHGGRDFEDLALLDPSDPKQWLLIISVETADDLRVYRKLYTGLATGEGTR